MKKKQQPCVKLLRIEDIIAVIPKYGKRMDPLLECKRMNGADRSEA